MCVMDFICEYSVAKPWVKTQVKFPTCGIIKLIFNLIQYVVHYSLNVYDPSQSWNPTLNITLWQRINAIYILEGGGGIGVMTLVLNKLQHQKVILKGLMSEFCEHQISIYM